jgi:hypothetical protein
MKDIVIQILTEESKKLIFESGIRNIKELSKRYPKAKIYFHQDLDGVTTALGMKNYLEQNGIKVVDSEIIQYGDKEFAIKKLDAEGDVMPVLVDFAHGKPMFVIHTDHHDTQAGVEQGTSTNFKASRSNVETISQTVSPNDIFPSDDITLISTVDSANYAQYDITPEEVMNYLFKVDKDQSLQKNKMVMGMVTNKLLLAFKNKPKFLENIVMNANPSLLSILMYIKSQIKDSGYADVDTLEKNKEMYVQSMKINKNVKVDDGIIVQYGGGSMMKPGSYDRYTPFRNNPDADFLVIAWPLGLVQASCNPFKKERALKGVNLGEIKDEVLNKWKSQLQNKDIPLSTIKWISESGKSFNEESVGFTFKDFNALYGKEFKRMDDGEKILNDIDVVMKKPFSELTQNEMKMLDSISVNAWDLIKSNSGGHKCITNISGLSYLGRSKRPPEGKYKYNSESDDSPYVKFTKMIQNEFARILKEKIKETNNVNENNNVIRKKDLIPNQINYKAIKNILIKEETFGSTWKSPIPGDADLLHSFERRKSDKKGALIATQIEEKLKKLYNDGINPDITDLKLNVDSKNSTVTWSATIGPSVDGKAYIGISTRGSTGGSSEKRALDQVGPLKRQLSSKGYQDITPITFDGKDHFVNPSGNKIHQYFFKYTDPNKYPPHPTKGGLNVSNTNTNTSSTTKSSENDLFGIKSILSKIKEKLFKNKTNATSPVSADGQQNIDVVSLQQRINKECKADVLNTALLNFPKARIGLPPNYKLKEDGINGSGTKSAIQACALPNVDTTSNNTTTDSNFKTITKKVIANFEGGYWNPFCPHPTSRMGKSTETMFGLDRYNGNIESTDKGKEFFKIIDDEKIAAGATSSGEGKNMKWTNMGNFCKKWKWLYRGGDKKEKLEDLATEIMEKYFNKNMSTYIKDPKTREKIMGNKGLLVHMSYATWNGPGFFQKFGRKLEAAVRDGKSDKELIDVATQSRLDTGLRQGKVIQAIQNPDGMKTA